MTTDAHGTTLAPKTPTMLEMKLKSTGYIPVCRPETSLWCIII